MHEYVVQSGPLSITILADCPREAAIEAVASWEERQTNASPRPEFIAPELSVRRRGQRVLRHFSAVRMLAQLRQRSIEETWKEVLTRRIASAN